MASDIFIIFQRDLLSLLSQLGFKVGLIFDELSVSLSLMHSSIIRECVGKFVVVTCLSAEE